MYKSLCNSRMTKSLKTCGTMLKANKDYSCFYCITTFSSYFEVYNFERTLHYTSVNSVERKHAFVFRPGIQTFVCRTP